MEILIFLAVIIIIFIAKGYVNCPSYKAVVIFDSSDKKNVLRCVVGGEVFVVPFIQDYDFLSLRPISIDINLKKLKTTDGLDILFFSNIIFAISTSENLLQNAAKELLGFSEEQISRTATEIIRKQIQSTVSNLSSEEIFRDEKALSDLIIKNTDKELNSLGLFVLNLKQECKIIQNDKKQIEYNIPQDSKDEPKPLAQENLNNIEENILDIQKEEKKEKEENKENNNKDVVVEAEKEEDEINIEDIVE